MAFTAPKLPTYRSNGTTAAPAPNAGNDLTEADQNNIRWLLNPNPDYNETDSSAAQANVASGLSGGSAAAASRLRLRDSELRSRFEQGHNMLEPYTGRAQQTALQTQSEAARLNDIAAQGKQAMEQLKLQEQGLSARQSESEQARLNELAQQGQQALAQLQASQTGQQSLQSSALAAELQRLGISEVGQNTRQQTQLGSAAAQQLADINARLEIARLEGNQAAQRQLQDEAARLTAQTQAEGAALNETNVRGAQTSDLSRQNFGQNLTTSIIDHYLTPAARSGSGGAAAPANGNGIQEAAGGTGPNRGGSVGKPGSELFGSGRQSLQGNDVPVSRTINGLPVYDAISPAASNPAIRGEGGNGFYSGSPIFNLRQSLSGLSSVQSLLKQYGI